MLRTVSRAEWGRALIAALVIMVLITLPYLIAANSATSKWRFSGFLFGVEDGNSYLAKMRQGAEGKWLFTLTYTGEPHDGAFLFAPYLLLGKLAALFRDPTRADFTDMLIGVYHAARFGFGLLTVLATYRFLALFLPRGSMRWAALWLIMLGGGLGWLLVLIGQGDWLGSAPVDFYLPEGYSFYILYGLPHLCLARAALLIGFVLFFEGGARRWIGAGACWLIMGLCVPFYIAVLYALLGAWGLTAIVRHRRFPVALFIKSLVAALIPLPVLLYNALVFSTNPIMGAWSNQNKLPSPNVLHYVAGFGVVYALAIPAIRWAWRRGRHQPAYLLLIAWIIAAPILAYTPVSVQRRLLEGIFVPACILAVAGLRYVIAPAMRYRRRTAQAVYRNGLIALFVLCLPTTLLILGSGARIGNTPSEPAYIPAETVAVLEQLNQAGVPGSVVLSSYRIGNLIPAYTPLRAYAGHGPETIDSDRKRLQYDEFLKTGTLAGLSDHKLWPGDPIRYVVIPATVYQADPARWNGATVKSNSGSYLIMETR